MLKGGYNLGGEQSGHIIFSDYATTGDGQLSAIKLMGVVREYGKKLSVISGVMNRFPQVMINIKANNGKEMLEENDLIRGEIDSAADELGADGRILVRASGTEPLIRVMVEGKELDSCQPLCSSDCKRHQGAAWRMRATQDWKDYEMIDTSGGESWSGGAMFCSSGRTRR